LLTDLDTDKWRANGRIRGKTLKWDKWTNGTNGGQMDGQMEEIWKKQRFGGNGANGERMS